MNKKYLIAYGVLAALTVLAYNSTRNFIIYLPLGKIHISNVTVNYILMYMIVGALSPQLAWRLFPKAPKWVAMPFTIGVTLTLLMLLSFWYPLRW